MISRNAKIICAVLYGLMCAANAVAFTLRLMPADADLPLWGYVAVHLSFPIFLPVIWGLVVLIVRAFYGKKAELEKAYVDYFSACQVAVTVWMVALDVYLLIVVPLTGGCFDAASYNRMLMVVGGLFSVGFGNVVPKLPYQTLRPWLEIGPERTYRVNRFGGRIMVAVGLLQLILALTLHLTNALFEAAFSATMALLLVPYLWVYAANLRAYRRETKTA